MTLGEKVKMFRKRKGLSQDELAKAAGYDSRSSIAKIEKGVSDPSQKALSRIADALEVRASDLISDDNIQDMPEQSQHGGSGTSILLAPKTLEARIVSFGMDSLPKDEREKILSILQTMYNNNPDLFKEESTNDA